jgi:hypothetical protein
MMGVLSKALQAAARQSASMEPAMVLAAAQPQESLTQAVQRLARQA